MLNAKCRKQHILRPLRKFPLYETSPQSAHTYTQARRHTALACFLPGFQLNSYAENEALKKKKKRIQWQTRSPNWVPASVQEHFQTSTRNDVIEKQKLQSSMVYFSYVRYSNSPKKWEVVSFKTTPETVIPQSKRKYQDLPFSSRLTTLALPAGRKITMLRNFCQNEHFKKWCNDRH